MAKSAPRFKWKFTYVRGWEGHRLGERIVKPERDYHTYAVMLTVAALSWVEPKRWRWNVEQYHERRGHLYMELLATGAVEFGNDVVVARERAMREAEAAYLWWRAGK